jgi:hypothetical protein
MNRGNYTMRIAVGLGNMVTLHQTHGRWMTI